MESKLKSLPNTSQEAGDIPGDYSQDKDSSMINEPKKAVTFKKVVEIVSFNDNWKMSIEKAALRTEEEQRLNFLQRGNY